MTALKKYAGCTQAQRVVDLAGTACPARPVHVQIGGLCSDGPSLDRGMHTPRVCSGGEGWLSRRRSACQGVNSRVMSKHRRNGCYHRQILRLVQPQRGDIWGNKRTYNGMSTLRDHHPVDTKGKTLTGCRRSYNIGFPGKNRRVSASVRTCQCAKSRVVPDEETCRRLLW